MRLLQPNLDNLDIDNHGHWIQQASRCSQPYSIIILSQKDLDQLLAHSSMCECLTHLAFATDEIQLDVRDLAQFTLLHSLEFWYSLCPYPRLEKLPVLSAPAKSIQICHAPPGLDTLAFFTPGMLQFNQVTLIECAHLMHLRFEARTNTQIIRVHQMNSLRDIRFGLGFAGFGNQPLSHLSLVDLPQLAHIDTEAPIRVKRLQLIHLPTFDYACEFHVDHGTVTIVSSSPITDFRFLRTCMHSRLDLCVPEFEPGPGLLGFDQVILRGTEHTRFDPDWAVYMTGNVLFIV
jgi:hypothetical protein